MQQDTNHKKSERAESEERMLAFWKENNIFKKSLEKTRGGKEFVFYEGPPTANAKPALHHLEARAFKDVIPRYKTMQGYHVRRKAGWDTHGLPVELQIEKALGLSSKKEIETYGIAAFNKKCKESVHTYIEDWKTFTERMGYWVDFDDGYYTYDPRYMEQLWKIVGKVSERGLLYKDYKVVPWCPRCGTGLSSHELAQGYQDVKDLSVYGKFKLRAGAEQFFQSSGRFAQPDIQKLLSTSAYILAWTTTPWTLPGNVALAVGEDIQYSIVKVGEEILILAKERLALVEQYEVIEEVKGSALVGLGYEPLYPFLADKLTAEQKENAFKVYAANFVTTEDGTGIVHTAVMYGQDDFELGTKVGLPKVHTVDESGHFFSGMDFLSGRFVKDEDVAVDIIKDLAHRGLLFKKEKYEHSYPHCWRCKTPLIYYARDSWYVAMSKLRDELVAQNETINWEPEHIKEGRFGEWLREVKDWAISRERYWGTPLPIWQNEEGEKLVVDSLETLKAHTKKSGNRYYAMRHGESVQNTKNIWSCIPGTPVDMLTEQGREQVKEAAEKLRGNVDIIVASPYTRSKQTAELVAEVIGIDPKTIVVDQRVAEWGVGSEFDQKNMDDYFDVRNESADRYHFKTVDGESYADVFARAGAFLYEIEEKYKDKKILIVSHGGASRAMELIARGFAYDTLFTNTREYRNFDNAEVREINFVPLPHNEAFEVDLHRPYIDEVVLEKDGKEYRRTKEVMDVWFDSGSMPFAQNYGAGDMLYPADFISEAIDQTRGWFYTLLAVGVLMERGTPYKNVICLGHLLDKDGKKMSKSLGNVIEPFDQMEKFGADAVRFWMYSVNAPGEGKNYDEKNIVEINNKVFNLINNVLSFYELYRDSTLETKTSNLEITHVLDQWILARLNQLISVTTESLDAFDLFKPTRAIRDFVEDLSTWYLRRSRDRIKDGDVGAKATLYRVLKTLAQVMAPFAPFAAEDLWQKLKNEGDEESVHLSNWPKAEKYEMDILGGMETIRDFAAQGNMLRKKLNIPLRQPLSAFYIPGTLSKEYQEILMDELNVKKIDKSTEIQKDVNVYFDEAITPELKLEGDYRELVRAIQDLRKEKGLSPSDTIKLSLPEKYEAIVDTYSDDLKKTVGAKDVAISGEEITLS